LVAVASQAEPRHYLSQHNESGATVPARFYVDSLVHDADALQLLLKYFGADRVALGSDYPFPLGEAHPGKLIESMDTLTPAAKAQLVGQTAAEFLGTKVASASSR
jgi:aminocarboxymuconate-semialdehyde decarboxylase